MKSKPHSRSGVRPADSARGNLLTRPGRTQPSVAAAQGKPGIDRATRHRMVSSAAYYRGEGRGFGEASELVDWLESRGDIDQSPGGGTLA